MSTYASLKGLKVRFLPEDPSTAQNSQVWYNSASSELKVGQVQKPAAWAAAANLPSTRGAVGSGGGAQNSGLAIGGQGPGSLNNTEEYNGSGWTAGGNYPTAQPYIGSGGPQTAALACGGGGYPSQTNTYDGSSWTSRPAMPVGMEAGQYTGTSASGLNMFGGTPSGYPADTIEWGGSSWTAGTATPSSGNYGCNATGPQTAAFKAGGNSPTTNETLNYDGTNWTAQGNLPAASYNACGSNIGSQTAGMYFGGGNPGTGNTTLLYDGSSWTTSATVPLTYTNKGSTWGPQVEAAVAGGTASTQRNETSEYSIPVETGTITTS